MARKKAESARIQALVKVWVEVEYDGLALSDAVPFAAELTVGDFVEGRGEILDSSIEIVGISKNFDL